MDRLSPLFNRFTPSTRLFHVGNRCQVSNFDASDGVGHLHLLRSGELVVSGPTIDERHISEASVLFSPNPTDHRLTPVHASGADLVCASVDLGNEIKNPFISAMPPLLIITQSEAPGLFTKLDWLFEEAQSDACGRDAAVELLMEYMLILLLRHVMDSGNVKSCVLTGLGDERLSRVITAIHENPEKPWTLELLAKEATMSRSRFAQHFKETVGATPLDYLTDWRLAIARSLLRDGESVASVARKVGYQDSAAFSRTFRRRSGQSPRDWLNEVKVGV